MLTTKDFVKAAEHIKKLHFDGFVKEAYRCYDLICDINDNPRFNHGLFYKKCFYEDEEMIND